MTDTTVRISFDTRSTLRGLGEFEGRSMAEILRSAIASYSEHILVGSSSLKVQICDIFKMGHLSDDDDVLGELEDMLCELRILRSGELKARICAALGVNGGWSDDDVVGQLQDVLRDLKEAREETA